MSGAEARDTARDTARDAARVAATGAATGQPAATERADVAEEGPADGETCDHCGSVFLEWRKCKLICRNCAQINKSCADL